MMPIDRKTAGKGMATAFRCGEGCFFVRRPLLAVLAGMMAALWITLTLFPVTVPDYEPCRGRTVTLTGTVSGIEPKREGDETVWRMTLSRISLDHSEGALGSMYESVSSGQKNAPSVPGLSAGLRLVRSSGEVQSDRSDPLTPGRLFSVLCILEDEPQIGEGALVRVRGRVTPFQGAMNEGEFDVRLYYHILRIAWSLRDVEIIAAASPEGSLDGLLFRVRRTISATIDRCFSPKNAPVVRAVLTGEKGMLEEETRDLYQGAGILHILSISGLHLSLLGMGIYSLSGRIRIRKKGIPLPARAFCALLPVFLYGKMTGMGTSAFRALVMLALSMTAGVIGRTYDLPTALGVAAALLLFDQPLYLFHTGFQFSFAAVSAIGILLPALPGGLAGRCLKILAIPLCTLPVCLWANGTFPVWSILLNLIVVPLMQAVMASACAAVLADLCFSAAGSLPARLLAVPAERILDLYGFLAGTAGKLPGSGIAPGRPRIWQILVFYAMLLALSAVSAHLQMPHVRRLLERPGEPAQETRKPDPAALLLRPVCRRLGLADNRSRRKAGALCILVWWAAAALVLTLRRPPAFEMDFLYVGQGDGIYIACRGRHFLIDGGSSSRQALARYTLVPFLHCKGTGRLDGVILTHDDIDHCSGLLELLESAAEGRPEIAIGRIYLPEIAEVSRGDHYRKIEDLAARARIPVSCLCRGRRLRAGPLCMDCLHPAQNAQYENANASSTTLLVRYRAFSALLTGDLEGQGEADLVDYLRKSTAESPDADREELDLQEPQALRLPVTLLKVAHHGSKYSTGADFLELASPDIAVISAGRNNRYGHPHAELLDRLGTADRPARVYRTDLCGEISLSLRRAHCEVKTFLPPAEAEAAAGGR